MDKRQKVLETLKRLSVRYELEEHEAVYTIEEMDRLGIGQNGEVVKNLFLRDAKGKRHFLVMLRKDKTADLKKLRLELDSTALSFGSEERLEKYLGLEKGAVTPFGVLGDPGRAVEVAIDQDLVGNPRLGVHPNENTATVWLSYADLERVLTESGHPPQLVRV